MNLGFIGEDFNIFEMTSTFMEYALLPLFNSYKTFKSGGTDIENI